jgi:broad specificity phosphatase PhoE
MVWLVRHGSRMDFVDPHWTKTAKRPFDPHLSPEGVIQAREVAQRFARESMDTIFASPFHRTIETAQAIAESLDRPIKIENGVAEWLHPEWFPTRPAVWSKDEAQKLFSRVEGSYQSQFELVYPEEEDAMMQRSKKTIQHLVEHFRQCLIVTHAAPMYAMAVGLVGEHLDLDCSFCSVIKLVETKGKWSVECAGDTSHLSCRPKPFKFK